MSEANSLDRFVIPGIGMRTVIVYKHVRKEGDLHYSKVEDEKGLGKFHQWGCDYEEFETGPGNYTTAIVERTDGTVDNVPAEMVQFVEV